MKANRVIELCMLLTAFASIQGCDGRGETRQGEGSASTAYIANNDLAGSAFVGGDGDVEIFGCDGAWTSRGVVERTGVFVLEDGELCVTPEGGEQFCRRITDGEDAENEVTLSRPGGTAPHRYRVFPIAGEGFCGPTRLRSEEIEALIRGASIVVEQAAEDSASRLMFRCDGSYLAVGGQPVEIDGQYSIAEDQLCVDVGAGAACRAVYRSGDGRHFVSAEPFGPHAPGELINDIAIERDEVSCEAP